MNHGDRISSKITTKRLSKKLANDIPEFPSSYDSEVNAIIVEEIKRLKMEQTK